MKSLKKVLTIVISFMISISVIGCNSNNSLVDDYDVTKRVALDQNEISYSLSDYETYFNYIEVFDDKGNVHKIGDPQVYRYNGEYYLYASLFNTNGIPCWKSKDMVNWEFEAWAYGDGTSGSGGDETSWAYAPEIIYYKGYFYLCEAPSGRGHYIFRSESPSGPFTICSENLGLGIDGSFYIGQDGNLYILSAINGQSAPINLTLLEFKSDDTVTIKKTTPVSAAALNGWTEAPCFIERNGINYITFSGNHVNSAGYRVGYASTSLSDNLFENFVKPEDCILLLSTGEDNTFNGGGYNSNSNYQYLDNYRGLGHNYNMYGPNLDSIYTAYHNAGRRNYDLNSTTWGFDRRYNLAQYYTNGTTLMTNGMSNFDTLMPTMADYTATNLTTENGWQLSTEDSESVYTAEINLKLSDGVGSVIFGYENSNNYSEIKINGSNLILSDYVDGQKTHLGTATILEDDFDGNYHTVKIVNGYNKSFVYYDNVKKFTVNKAINNGGKIGVKAGNIAGAVQFTNDAFGTSDFESVKNLTGTFPAYTYLKEENRGYSIKDAVVKTDGVRQGEKESVKKVGEIYSTVLQSGDWVKYAINAPKAATYNLNVKVNKASEGCIFEVIIDDVDIFKMKITDASLSDNDYITVNAGKFKVNTVGVHSMKIRVYKGTLDLTDISTTECLDISYDGSFTTSLTENFNEGKKIIGNSTFSDKGMTTLSTDKHSLYYFGNKGATSFEYSVDISIKSGAAGLLFRTKNFSYATEATTPYSFQGYYLKIYPRYAVLLRYDYGISPALYNSTLNIDGQPALINEAVRRITVKGNQNNFEIYLEENLIMKFTLNNFIDGYCGLYSNDSEVTFKNLTYIKR